MNTQNDSKMLNSIRAMCLGTVICGLIAWSHNPLFQTILMIISIIMCLCSTHILKKEHVAQTRERYVTYLAMITIILTIIVEVCLIIQNGEYFFFEYSTIMFLLVQSGEILTIKITTSKIDILTWILLIIAIVGAIFT